MSRKSQSTAERIDIYQDVTSRIVAELEKGVGHWTKSWRTAANIWRPVNQHTGSEYRGINVLLLAITIQSRGYSANKWLTFRQALELGGNVRKGSKGVRLVFWRKLKDDSEAPTGEETENRVRMVAKHFTVFNVGDCDGLPIEEGREHDRNDQAEHIITASGATILAGEPAYSPSRDVIYLPALSSFGTPADYYATALHELTHWTAPRVSRLVDSKRWGDDAYAVEELVAELGAAMLCGHCDIPATSQCASYLANWLRVLKQDKRAIFSVAAQAQRAADFLLARAGHNATDQPEEEAAQ